MIVMETRIAQGVLCVFIVYFSEHKGLRLFSVKNVSYQSLNQSNVNKSLVKKQDISRNVDKLIHILDFSTNFTLSYIVTLSLILYITCHF